MSEQGLQAALAAMHIDGEIESHGKVAVLVASRPEQLADADARAAAGEAAIQQGFRALAVELSGGTSIPDSRFPIPDRAGLHSA